MKTKILLSLLFLAISIKGFCTTWTISNSGTTFTPNTITITFGDTVNFAIAIAHNAREVSLATWDANGNTALAGGFQTSFGGGLVLPALLGVGTHYFVCEPHASSGMKGTIIVQNSTGIAENQLMANISVFPNPASDFIQISGLSKTENYKVFDLLGSIILEGNINKNEQINIQDLTNGIYFIRFGNGKTIKFNIRL